MYSHYEGFARGNLRDIEVGSGKLKAVSFCKRVFLVRILSFWHPFRITSLIHILAFSSPFPSLRGLCSGESMRKSCQKCAGMRVRSGRGNSAKGIAFLKCKAVLCENRARNLLGCVFEMGAETVKSEFLS